MGPFLELELSTQVLLVGAALAAGFVDAIAGGGGLITLPALLACGLPPSTALATNKLQATFGSASAAWHYRRAGWVSLREAGPGVAATAAGALAGVLAVMAVDPGLLRRLMPVLLLAAVAMVWLGPGLRDTARPARLRPEWLLPVGGVLLGFYDGFFGPGTGTLWALLLVVGRGDAVLKATAWTKVMNVTSNVVSLGAFAAVAQLDWTVGLMMGAAQWAGARGGARVAVRGGARVIRPVFLTVALALVVRLAWQGWR